MTVTKKPLEKIVQDNIQYFRNELEWTQEKLAEKAKLSKIYLAEIESHKRKPSIPMMEKIADALGIDPYMLMVEKPKDFLSLKKDQNEIIEQIMNSIRKLKS